MIIVGLDLETTGLSQEGGHRIVEIATVIKEVTVCPIAGPTIAHKGAWTTRINPQRPIDPGAQRVHGISFEDVALCPTWDKVAPTVQRMLKVADLVVAHNGAEFDLPFIALELARVGLSPIHVPFVDTCKMATWATPNGKNPKLQELCFATGVPYDPELAHAALYDVQVMLDAFFVGVKKGFFTLPTIQPQEVSLALVS
jgi:DNA polymerase-3 subunit epsilon